MISDVVALFLPLLLSINLIFSCCYVFKKICITLYKYDEYLDGYSFSYFLSYICTVTRLDGQIFK